MKNQFSVPGSQFSATCGFLVAALLGVTVLLSTATVSAQDKPIVLKGGKLLTITHGVIENGAVVLQGGKITAVGPAASVNIPGGAQVLDVTGMTVYPGLIDSETNLGLTEISAENMTNDLVEMSDEIMPHMHTAEAFHAESALIPVARMNGITNAVVALNERRHSAGPRLIHSAGRRLRDRDAADPRSRNATEFYRRRTPQQGRLR